jgi:hypothetical protein
MRPIVRFVLALEDVLFAFRKVNEEEMIIADKLKDTLSEEHGKY